MANDQTSNSIMKEDRGETLVEFAIAGLLLFIGLFTLTDFARAMYTYHFVSYAAQEGTRYAVVRGNDWGSTDTCASASATACIASSANITSFVQGLATPGIQASSIVVTPSWLQKNVDGSSTGCSTTATQNSKGCLVKVQVSYSFHFMLMAFLPQSLNMSATSEQVIAY